ncbi:MAG: septum site-determining protein MinC [Rhodanobacter denitrificans]|uniref:Probable septum site-determining protein MinC n=1 Tax=Rhodanobacter denitrificans TaxID=666685 RepID=A0A2W5LXJ0_9GAMM|nr:MAG: septum site-determining protein MinC [Rhodanobacter denitrificans]
MTTAAISALEPVGELKFGQVGIANLRLKRLDGPALEQELADKVRHAPHLFERAPLVVDLSHLPALPDVDTVQALLAHIRRAGLIPVGLAYGTSDNEQLARALGLPLLAKFRAAYERAGGEPMVATTPPPSRTAPAAAEPAPAAPAPAVSATAGGGATLHVDQPVRSGQQVYARGGDLVLNKLVANGAEVIADGSIHIYGALRGRALAGALGDEKARIYCREFHAELVSIAGHYRVFESIPDELRGQPVQVGLDGEKLVIARF